jgi:tetratricopeptide (TPR) repeat protein
MAGERLERLGFGSKSVAALTIDTYRKAVEQRPDHPTGHRLLAYALLKVGRHEEAFAALETAYDREYPSGRFLEVKRILLEDLGLVGTAWIAADPKARARVEKALTARGGTLDARASTRFVLVWETDANDVDLHVYDDRGNHAFYSHQALGSGGELYADVTTGFGPEVLTIPGRPKAGPYRIQAHYYRRGPMGYGMGKLQVIEHDGKGGLDFAEHPFVIMRDDAFVDLATVR